MGWEERLIWLLVAAAVSGVVGLITGRLGARREMRDKLAHEDVTNLYPTILKELRDIQATLQRRPFTSIVLDGTMQGGAYKREGERRQVDLTWWAAMKARGEQHRLASEIATELMEVEDAARVYRKQRAQCVGTVGGRMVELRKTLPPQPEHEMSAHIREPMPELAEIILTAKDTVEKSAQLPYGVELTAALQVEQELRNSADIVKCQEAQQRFAESVERAVKLVESRIKRTWKQWSR